MDINSFCDIDILSIKKGVIVNPVNCVGIMGAGLALQFKEKYKKNFYLYQKYCKEKKLKPGGIFCTKENELIIINIATKNHYSESSSYKIISDGIINICKYINDNLKSNQDIYIPALGCGLGGLDWELVRYNLLSTIFCYNLEKHNNYYIISPKE